MVTIAYIILLVSAFNSNVILTIRYLEDTCWRRLTACHGLMLVYSGSVSTRFYSISLHVVNLFPTRFVTGERFLVVPWSPAQFRGQNNGLSTLSLMNCLLCDCFSGSRPIFRSMDDIWFRKSVEIGSILEFTSQVGLTLVYRFYCSLSADYTSYDSHTATCRIRHFPI